MNDLIINATHSMSKLTGSFWQPDMIFLVVMCALCLAASVGFAVAGKNDMDLAGIWMFPFAAGFVLVMLGGLWYSEYVEEPHVKPANISISKELYTLETNNGDVVAYTKAGDEKGTLRVRATDTHKKPVTIKISKKTADIGYNSGKTPFVELTKVHDKATGNNYYITDSIGLNNQPLNFK